MEWLLANLHNTQFSTCVTSHGLCPRTKLGLPKPALSRVGSKSEKQGLMDLARAPCLVSAPKKISGKEEIWVRGSTQTHRGSPSSSLASETKFPSFSSLLLSRLFYSQSDYTIHSFVYLGRLPFQAVRVSLSIPPGSPKQQLNTPPHRTP